MRKIYYPLLLIILFSGCKLFNTLKFGYVPKQNSYKHFDTRIIKCDSTLFKFKQPSVDYKLGKKIGLTNRDLNSTNVSLDSFVNLHNTISFLIIRNDTILYNFYRDKYSDSSMVSSFSLSKPIISTLIGIAIDEKKISSIDDLLVCYLPELNNKPGWNKITLKHLLHHTSGIKFTDAKLNPLSDNSVYFWGHNLRKEVKRAKLKNEPDKTFKYSSINTLLLGMVLEKATGNTISNYLQEKIWKPLGMESDASWSLDRNDERGIEKAFCCLQASTLDFAKLGRLYLNNGFWNGKQIVSPNWIDYSIHPDPTGNNKHFFNNNWGIGPIKYGSYYAIGLYGQFLYMYPEKNILIVRFGDAQLDYHPNFWSNIFLQLIDQM